MGNYANGTLYAVGVGPGDPELLTCKAVRVLRSADVIACPAKGNAPGTAYRIALQAVPEIGKKRVLALSFPMTGEDCTQAHAEAASCIMSELREGRSVAFLTLGDPGFYSTFFHIFHAVAEGGFPAEIVSGIPSFCAASARIMMPLAVGDGQVLITSEPRMDFPGTIVVMKVGRRLQAIKAEAAGSRRAAYLVENCGMEGERVYRSIETMPEETGYFSLMIIEQQGT